MFTAIAIVCMLEGPPSCEAVTNKQFFTTREACLQDKASADRFALSVGKFVFKFECYNWGVST